ncbi:MAG: hypothetical protein P4L43_01900 [Syntrophobacteraceae bacterium]|nr:hypothetical protein [Syntrophobacteraceae bacterium]
MNSWEETLRQAVKEVFAELREMDKDELRCEIRNREIGGFGAVLLEAGALETGLLHVAVEIPTWDDPFDSAASDRSWECVEVVNRGGSELLWAGSFDFGAHTLSIPANIEDCRASQGDLTGADDYTYSVAA